MYFFYQQCVGNLNTLQFYLQFETINVTSSDDNSCNGGDIFSTDFILTAIEHTIWSIFFIFGLGRFIFPENQWFESEILWFVAFFVIIGSWGLEIYGISGKSMSHFIAMFFVLSFSLIRYVLTMYFIMYTHNFHFQSRGMALVTYLIFGIAIAIRLAIQKEITDRLGNALKRQQSYEEI